MRFIKAKILKKFDFRCMSIAKMTAIALSFFMLIACLYALVSYSIEHKKTISMSQVYDSLMH